MGSVRIESLGVMSAQRGSSAALCVYASGINGTAQRAQAADKKESEEGREEDREEGRKRAGKKDAAGADTETGCTGRGAAGGGSTAEATTETEVRHIRGAAQV